MKKKRIALLGVLGAAGGLLYALESQYRRNKAGSPVGESDDRSSDSEHGSRESINQKRTAETQNHTGASMARIEDGEPAIGDHQLDDQGTDQFQAAQILRSIRDQAFGASDEKLALALGRPPEEIAEWTGGQGSIDGDVLMKARTLAMQRGFEV